MKKNFTVFLEKVCKLSLFTFFIILMLFFDTEGYSLREHKGKIFVGSLFGIGFAIYQYKKYLEKNCMASLILNYLKEHQNRDVYLLLKKKEKAEYSVITMGEDTQSLSVYTNNNPFFCDGNKLTLVKQVDNLSEKKILTIVFNESQGASFPASFSENNNQKIDAVHKDPVKKEDFLSKSGEFSGYLYVINRTIGNDDYVTFARIKRKENKLLENSQMDTYLKIQQKYDKNQLKNEILQKINDENIFLGFEKKDANICFQIIRERDTLKKKQPIFFEVKGKEKDKKFCFVGDGLVGEENQKKYMLKQDDKNESGVVFQELLDVGDYNAENSEEELDPNSISCIYYINKKNGITKNNDGVYIYKIFIDRGKLLFENIKYLTDIDERKKLFQNRSSDESKK